MEVTQSEKSPTPYLRVFPNAKVKVATGDYVYDSKGRIKDKVIHGVLVEYRAVCPWNPQIDLLSEECAACKENRRIHVDQRYPSFSCVCQRVIDKVPVPLKAAKRAREIIRQRIKENTPAAYLRYREEMRHQIFEAKRNAMLNTKKKRVKKGGKP